MDSIYGRNTQTEQPFSFKQDSEKSLTHNHTSAFSLVKQGNTPM